MARKKVAALALLLNNAAGHPITRVTCRLRFVIVFFGVHYQRRAALFQQRFFGERNVFRRKHGVALAVFADFHVRHIAFVRAVLHFAVGMVAWREMTAGRFEIGAIAFAVFVNVEGMLARGKIVEHGVHFHAFLGGS